MGKLSYRNVIYTVTLFVAIAYVICRLFYVILPEQTVAFANNLFHGIQSSVTPFAWSNFVLGLIESVILSVSGSALFVWIYNKIAKK